MKNIVGFSNTYPLDSDLSWQLKIQLKVSPVKSWLFGEIRVPLKVKQLRRTLKNALYLSVNVFSPKVVIEDTIFTSPTGDVTSILNADFTWSSRPHEDLAQCLMGEGSIFISQLF